ALTFILFLWGALVRTTGSGLGCPDWPMCHGQWIPDFDRPTFFEWCHRLIAMITGLATLTTSLVIWGKKQHRQRCGFLAGLAMTLLLVQASLGGAAVLTELQPYLVSIHLGVGMLFLTVLLWMRLETTLSPSLPPRGGGRPKAGRGGWFSFLLIFITLLVFAQSILGGYVASSNASLACPDFPLCQGQWIPILTGNVAIHFFHRVGALVTLVAVVILLVAARRSATPALKTILSWVGIVTVTQLLLGIANIVWALPMTLRVAHLGVATVLYGLLIMTIYEVRRVRVS
ncbi:MAG: COX15/CtaA family protein, partial [Deltaproteobacteria bacterium]|nr:COX15/CtaA family protein [Deltaproteobacteria bacterium]